ncbi:MAG: M56 family metallopeptidase [Bacteroidales bacterium]
MVLLYIIKSTISLSIFYLFYYFFISKEKLHAHKRIYLLFALTLSLVVPLLQINLEFFSSISLENNIPVLHKIPSSQNHVLPGEYSHSKQSFNGFLGYLKIAYLFVLVMLFVRFLINIFRLVRSDKNQLSIKYGKYKVSLLERKIVPYSFFNRIYVNRQEWENGEIDKALILHEIYHIRNFHSFDLIFVEFLQVLLWFNPLLILYKREIRLNHEHQVDQQVIDELGNLKYYQEILLSAASKNLYKQFASGFDSSMIKKRLIMMTAHYSVYRFNFKLLVILPIALLMTASLVIGQDFRDGNLLSNPHFIKMAYPKIDGIWTGEGAFMWNQKLNKELGLLDIQINIDTDLNISGRIGDARFTDGTIEIAQYGLEIVCKLKGKVKVDHQLKKQHVVFLIALPEIENNTLEANFHMLNNLNWDKYMRVGRVMLERAD